MGFTYIREWASFQYQYPWLLTHAQRQESPTIYRQEGSYFALLSLWLGTHFSAILASPNPNMQPEARKPTLGQPANASSLASPIHLPPLFTGHKTSLTTHFHPAQHPRASSLDFLFSEPHLPPTPKQWKELVQAT